MSFLYAVRKESSVAPSSISGLSLVGYIILPTNRVEARRERRRDLSFETRKVETFTNLSRDGERCGISCFDVFLPHFLSKRLKMSGRRLYVGRLDADATRKDVEDYFSTHGPIVDVRLMAGFCFLEYQELKVSPRRCRSA